MMTPKVTVAIPLYNAEQYIAECLESILSQTFQDWECVIVNDGSTDNSLSVVQTYVDKDQRFRCYTIENTGSAKIPRDTAIAKAESEWIIAVDSDDYIEADYIEKLYNRATANKLDIVYPILRLFQDSDPSDYIDLPSRDFDLNTIVKGKELMLLTFPVWKIGGAGALMRKAFWAKLSTFQKGPYYMNIDEYDTRELASFSDLAGFADTIYYYRQHKTSITKKPSLKFFDRIKTDDLLEKLFTQHFSDIDHIRMFQDYKISNLMLFYIYYFENKNYFSSAEKQLIKQNLKKAFNTIDKKNVWHNNTIKRLILLGGHWLFEKTTYMYYYFVAKRNQKDG